MTGKIAKLPHFSHSAQCFSFWDVYRNQFISHSSCRPSLTAMYGSYNKILWFDRVRKKTLFIFRAILENTSLVQWINCSPKGSRLIHWTTAVFSHNTLKWTPLQPASVLLKHLKPFSGQINIHSNQQIILRYMICESNHLISETFLFCKSFKGCFFQWLCNVAGW